MCNSLHSFTTSKLVRTLFLNVHYLTMVIKGKFQFNMCTYGLCYGEPCVV